MQDYSSLQVAGVPRLGNNRLEAFKSKDMLILLKQCEMEGGQHCMLVGSAACCEPGTREVKPSIEKSDQV